MRRFLAALALADALTLLAPAASVDGLLRRGDLDRVAQPAGSARDVTDAIRCSRFKKCRRSNNGPARSSLAMTDAAVKETRP